MNRFQIRYDTATGKWMREHLGVETTVVQCAGCGLFYKPELGHKCKLERRLKNNDNKED